MSCFPIVYITICVLLSYISELDAETLLTPCYGKGNCGEYNDINQGRIYSIQNWKYTTNGRIKISDWYADNKQGSARDYYGSTDGIDGCIGFTLTSNDFIIGYKVWDGDYNGNDYMFGIEFYTRNGHTYNCIGDPSKTTHTNSYNYHLYDFWYLTGWIVTEGSIIDAIQFQFTKSTLTAPPTLKPTMIPTFLPSFNPSMSPANNPTSSPSNNPTNNPTAAPTTLKPTTNPIKQAGVPTVDPTMGSTIYPTKYPTHGATEYDRKYPSPDPTKDPTEKSLFVPVIPNKPTASPTFKPTETDRNSKNENGDKTVSEGEGLSFEIIIVVILSILCLICVVIGVCCIYKTKKKEKVNKSINPKLETVGSNTFDKNVDINNLAISRKESNFYDNNEGNMNDNDDDKRMDGIHITGADDNDSNHNNKAQDFGRMLSDDVMVETLVMNDILDEMVQDKVYKKNSYNKGSNDHVLRDNNIHITAGENNHYDDDDDVLSDDIHVTAGGPFNGIDTADDILLDINQVKITEEGANDMENDSDDDEIVLYGIETMR